MFINPVKFKIIPDNSISFKAGQTSIFADFDKTYTPFSHAQMCYDETLPEGSEKRYLFNDYFQKIKDFSDTAKGKVLLTITTGRNISEYKYVEKRIKDKNLNYFSPDAVVTRDGGDRFVKQNDRWQKDKTKSGDIEKSAGGWDSLDIKIAIKNIIRREFKNPAFIESPVNRTKDDYGEMSLEAQLDNLPPQQAQNYVSFTKDEDNAIEIAFSNNLPTERIKKDIEDYLNKNQIKAVVKHYPKDYNGYCPQIVNGQKSIEPGNKMFIKPAPEDRLISKLYDVKQALKNVVTNNTNDLIIAAGDEGNDEEMLNPLNYLDLYSINIDKTKPYEELLKDEKILSSIAQMPFCAIIVGGSQKLDHLRHLDVLLKEKGINKFVCIKDSLDKDNGFLKAIKTAMFDYAQQNPEYSFEMGMDLYMSLVDAGGSLWA